MHCVGLPNTPGGESFLCQAEYSKIIFSFLKSKSQKWRLITHTLNCWRWARTSWECWTIPVTRQRQAWQSHWVLITTAFNWNRISFSRLRWHPGHQILKAGPCKSGNNKLQWAEQRFKTTDLCLLILRGSSISLLCCYRKNSSVRTVTSRSSFQLQALANVYYGVCDYGMDEMSWCCLIAVAAFYCIQSDTEAETSARAELSSFCAASHNMYVRLSKLLLHILLILIWFLIFF